MSDIVEIMAVAIVNGDWDELPEMHKVLALFQARAALSALREHHAVVPREATVEMLASARARAPYGTAGEVWSAMLAAAEREG